MRGKFAELCQAVRGAPKRYLLLWRNKWLTSKAKSLDEMIAMLRDAAGTLEAMRLDGVVLDAEGGAGDDYAHLVTTDPEVARKYGMHDEAEFWGSDDTDEDAETA